jgi:hypothetical protein
MDIVQPSNVKPGSGLRYVDQQGFSGPILGVEGDREREEEQYGAENSAVASTSQG